MWTAKLSLVDLTVHSSLHPVHIGWRAEEQLMMDIGHAFSWRVVWSTPIWH
jgi:hypothetical protein